MTFSYFRVSPTNASNLTPSDINELVSSLLKLAGLTVDFEGGLGRSVIASTPTFSSPQPQAGAVVGGLTMASLSASITGPQAPTYNFNLLLTSPSAPIVADLGLLNISTPLPTFSGLFNFVACFNFAVIVCLLYLIFTPPLGGATTDDPFGAIDVSPTHDFESNVTKTHPPCPCRNSSMIMAKPTRPRGIRVSNSVKQQVAPVSPSKPPHNSPLERSLVLYTPPPTVPTESFEPPVQPANAIDPPTRVGPKSHTKATEDMGQATRTDPGGIQRRWDIDSPLISDNSRREFFLPDPVTNPSSSLAATGTGHAGRSELHNESRDLETVNTQGEAGPKVGSEKGKESSGAVGKYRCRPTEEIVPNRDLGLVQKTVVPPVQAPVIPLNVKSDPLPQSQPLILKPSVWTQQPVPLPTPQQLFIPQPAVNTPLPTTPVGPIHATISATQGLPPPAISVPVQPPMPMALHTAPPAWLQQQVVIGPGSCFQTPLVAPLVTIPPLPQIARPTFAPVLIGHYNKPEPNQDMDVVDDDGDSWMRPSWFGETITPQEPAKIPPVQVFMTPPGPISVPPVQTPVTPPVQTPVTPPGPAPLPPVQTLVVPAVHAPQRTHVITPAQQPTVSPNWWLLDPATLRFCKKVRASRLPYGSHRSIASLAPSQNRWVGRLRRSVQPGRSGSTSARNDARNKDIARASRLEKRSLLRKKLAARPPKQRTEKPTPRRVDDQSKAGNPTALAGSSSAQKKARTYYDRLYVTRASPLSQRGPSEVSLLACKVAPKSASLRKAFILERHLAARDRRAAGTEGRARVVHQNGPTAGQQTIAGAQHQATLLHRKAPVGDHVYPRRKRKTAADFIRAEDAEKEKEALDAAADALQSMGLNSEASTPASSSSVSEPDAPLSNPTASSSSVTQDPEFNQDQAQLLLEDIFEDFEQKQNGLAVSFSSSSASSGSGSDPDSDDD